MGEYRKDIFRNCNESWEGQSGSQKAIHHNEAQPPSLDSDLESDSHCLQPVAGTRSSSRGRRSVSLPVYPSQLNKPTIQSYPTWDGRVSPLEKIRKSVALRLAKRAIRPRLS